MTKKIIKISWIALAVLILGIALFGFDGEPHSDIWILLTWGMLILSFPFGALVSLIHMILGRIFLITIHTSYFSLIIEWLIYLILGYFQWFKLFPYVVTKLRMWKRVQ